VDGDSAECLFTLPLWGAIAPCRDEALLTRVMKQVRAAAQPGQLLLVVVDGFASYVSVIRKVFRDPHLA
jgi:hypothetical protein